MSGAGMIRDPFPNNTIPAAIMDPVGVKTVALYPQPTGAGDRFTQARNYSATGKTVNLSDRSDIRIDWARNEKHSMYGRLSRAWRQQGQPPPDLWQSLAGTGSISGNPRYQISLGTPSCRIQPGSLT